MNIVKGVADLLRKSTPSSPASGGGGAGAGGGGPGGGGGGTGSPSADKFAAAPSPRVRFRYTALLLNTRELPLARLRWGNAALVV